MDNVDWTEIQTIICIAKGGSLSAAARELGVNHSTVLRRVQSFEEKHHVNVFVRESSGYRLSRHGRALLQDFDRLDDIMQGLRRRITDYDTQLEGRLTITSTENIFGHFLQSPLFEFAQVFPRVNLDLLISNQLVDMSQLEADVAVRPAERIPKGQFGFKLFSLYFYFYVPQTMASQLSPDAIADFPHWVGFSGALSQARAGQVLHQTMNGSPTISANSFDGVSAAANAGLGLALLPSFIGDVQPNLIKGSGELIFSTDVFVMAPEDLSVSRRVNAIMNFLNTHFNSESLSDG